MRRSRNLLLAPALVLGTVACSATADRRPVAELYREALDASRLDQDPAVEEARAATARAAARADVSELGDGSLSAAHEVADEDTRRAAQSPPVSDVFADTDIREALQGLATQAGVRVAIDDSVRGTVSAVFEAVPFEEALLDLLAPRGLVFERLEGRYFVGSPEPASALFPMLARTVTYVPKHLTTQELLEVLPKFAAPYLCASPARNAMTITAPRALCHRILAELARADRAIPQVMLEVIVCEFSPGTKQELGFDFEGGFEGPDGQHTNLGIRDLQMAGAHGPPQMAGLMSFQFASAYVRALASEGYVSIRAAPRVLVRDGEKASIAIGEDTFFTVSNEQFVIQQLQSVRSGITLELTPRIGDGVTIHVDRAEVSDELRPSQIVNAADARLPSINTRKVSTTVTVKDGQTVVIGGLVRRRQVERVVRVPLIGDVPILGLLFQKSETRDEETEVAIFLSPRVVRS